MSDTEDYEPPTGVTIAPKEVSVNDIESIRSLSGGKKSKSKGKSKQPAEQPDNSTTGQLVRKKAGKKLKTRTLGKKDDTSKKAAAPVESDFKIEGYPIIVAAINNGILNRNHIHGIFQGFGIGPIHEHPGYCIIEMTSQEDQDRAIKKNRAEYKNVIVLVDKYDASQEDPRPPMPEYGASRYSHRENSSYVDDMPRIGRPSAPSFQLGSRKAPSYGDSYDRPDRAERPGYSYDEPQGYDRGRSGYGGGGGYGSGYGSGHGSGYGRNYDSGSRYDNGYQETPKFSFGAKKQEAPSAPTSSNQGFSFGQRRQQQTQQSPAERYGRQETQPSVQVSRNPFADLNDD